MPEATITVQGCWPPKEGKPAGSMKAQSDQGQEVWFDVWPDKVPILQAAQGARWTIQFSSKQVGDKTYHRFQKMISGPHGSQAPQGGAGGPPPQGTLHPPGQPSGAQRPAQGPGNGHDQSRNIFITGVVQQSMRSGLFDAEGLVVVTKKACEAWDIVRNWRSSPPEPEQEQQGDPAGWEPDDGGGPGF